MCVCARTSHRHDSHRSGRSTGGSVGLAQWLDRRGRLQRDRRHLPRKATVSMQLTGLHQRHFHVRFANAVTSPPSWSVTCCVVRHLPSLVVGVVVSISVTFALAIERAGHVDWSGGAGGAGTSDARYAGGWLSNRSLGHFFPTTAA